MKNNVSNAIIVSKTNTGNRFPACLLDFSSYTAGKSIVAIMFACSCLYFLAGIYHFICWENGSFLFELLTKPFYLLYHIGVFTTMYCITWATFDINSFKTYSMRLLGVIAAIAYVCLPTDLIPDFIPLIGQLDDLVAVAFGIYSAVAMGKPYIKAKKNTYTNSIKPEFNFVGK